MKVSLLDITWELHDANEFNQLLTKEVESGTQLTVSSLNLHAIYLYHKNKAFKNYVDTSAAHIDGMPIMWMLRLAGYKKLSPTLRITWVDWMIPLLMYCQQNNYRVVYLGGKPGVAERGLRKIEKSVPGLLYTTFDGYFNMDPPQNPENTNLINKINNFKPNLLIVGMGMGRQEKWIYENKQKLNANFIITSGAAAEYFSGDVSTPPRWMGTAGLEWLFRFAENPKRFWFRYLVEPWFILSLYFRKSNNDQ